MNTEQLVKGCIQGERKAQNELYKMLYSPLMGICMRYKRNRDDAASALNMGFVKIITGLNKYDVNRDLKGWCCRIMVNYLIDEYRSKAAHDRQGKVFYDEGIENTDYSIDTNGVEEDIQAEDLRDMLKELPPVMNQVFNLHAIDGYSHHEIAQRLEMAESTSRWHLAEARKRLQKMFFERYSPTIKKSLTSEIR